MTYNVRFLTAFLAALGLVATSGFAFAPSDDKGQNPKGQLSLGPSKGKKQRKDYSGKALLGDKIKRNGPHKLQEQGSYSAFVNVSKGKITGMRVKHADKGSVPVTKYKTTRNIAQAQTSGAQFPPRASVAPSTLEAASSRRGWNPDTGRSRRDSARRDFRP